MGGKWRKYPFREMVTHKFPLERINEAFEVQRSLGGMKVVVLPYGEPPT
jgi:Zn-dependent alcohol dehydrogenase